jgi:hypothetical protein
MSDPITRSIGGSDLTSRFIENHTVSASPSAGSITTVATLTWSPQDSPSVVNGALLRVNLALTIGTNGVSALLQIRRTNSSGTIIASTGAVTVVATDLYELSTQGIDQVAFVPGQAWVACLTIGSGSATSTVSSVSLSAIII